MAERKEVDVEETAAPEFVETVVDIKRTSTVVKGGRRFSFSGLVVVGNGMGRVGFGYGKANGVPIAIEKGTTEANRSMVDVQLTAGTIPHEVWGCYGAAKVLLKPASPGTGIIAGGAVRAVVEAAGVKNILTKSIGSNNAINLVKATMNGLLSLRSREQVESLRGVSLEKE